jgi:catechol 2,3-dioxygenase-like lactoylglutathione lyase family enzyme
MIIDHFGFHVSDFPTSKAFYLRALEPLGIGIIKEGEGWAFMGRDGVGQFWIDSFGNSPSGIHIAFSAESREQVRRFYKAALAAGGNDNGGPGVRSRYHPNYYGAYVIGPDGHNLEAVCHVGEGE